MIYTMIDRTGEGHYDSLRDAISNADYDGAWKVVNSDGHVVACSRPIIPNNEKYCLSVTDNTDDGDLSVWAGFFASIDDAVREADATDADWTYWYVTNTETGRVVARKEI